ncbi:sporulation protein [Fictibacillus fluitans]|uniref:Sporulation protein n=1 Tax=Fictibacillus fluitans TaxID=3058422 RepID=A0ABT8I1T7_9BACL|nr:sporulation protein [Fictibacillus sp. NE201]MDN4526995.1 sporulation protein [Fictibacillus sp. NE201]
MIKGIVSKLKKEAGPALDSSVFYPGGKLEGQWSIGNGVVPEQGCAIDFELILEYQDGQLRTKKSIKLQEITETRKQNENGFILSFSACLPEDLPISCTHISYKVQAGVRGGKNRGRSYMLPICIKGRHEFLQVFYALGALGFHEMQQSGFLNGNKQIFRFASSVFKFEFSAMTKKDGMDIFFSVIKLENHRKADSGLVIFLSAAQLKSRICVEEALKEKLVYMTKE